LTPLSTTQLDASPSARINDKPAVESKLDQPDGDVGFHLLPVTRG
jgi:hypothetical protein